jgi:hypothetical protein
VQNRTLRTVEALDLGRDAGGPIVDELHAYLSRFGWLRLPDQAPVVAAHDQLPEAEPGYFDEPTEAALTEFQRFYRLPVTGRLNGETLALIQRRRCGVPDRAPVHRAGPAEFVAAGTKWSDLSLGYNLSRSTADLSDGDVSAALYYAYRSWCLVARIVVQQVSANADIDVRFETGDHGDGWPFDGAGDTRNVLAHGFYPPSTSSTAIAGDLHFDDDETWTRDLPPTGTDLDTVALHEAGHTLGLDHSATTSAVMYAFYGGARRTLTSDDIEGIRSLYGTRERNVFRDLDAAVEGQGRFHGKGYFFYGFRYLRYDFSDDLPDPGYPRHIRTEWHGLPDGWGFPRGIDAAMNGQLAFDGKLYMFRGDQYVRYDWESERTDLGPLSIGAQWQGIPADFAAGVDAAVTGRGPYAGKAYFFKGDQYVRYDWSSQQIDPEYPKPIAGLWPGFPAEFTSGIQAAMNGQGAYEGKLWLFKGSDYIRYDWQADQVDPGYPLPIEFNWL